MSGWERLGHAALLGVCALIVTQPSASTQLRLRGSSPRPAAGLARTPAHEAEQPRLAQPERLQPMTRIPGGDYRPFYRTEQGAKPISVPEFWLDVAPVSRASYAQFVAEDAAWRRSRVEPLFAEAQYLADWSSDSDAGELPSDGPVQLVSWFAAKAYCAWQGKRLPSVVEWELAASLSAVPVIDAPAAAPALWEWAVDFNSIPTASGGADAGSGTSLFCGAGARARDARDYGAFLRYAFRSSLKANYTLKKLGFRCAKGDAR